MPTSVVPTVRRIRIGKLPIDAVTLDTALGRIDAMVQSREGGTVFTPNVDHVVVAEENSRFCRAYADVGLSLVDGVPVLWGARVLGERLPEKISGSDLVFPVLELAQKRQYRVYFLGADPGVADRARRVAELRLPAIRIVGVDDSRIDVDALDPAVLARIQAARPDLVLVALGAPKQEIFCGEHREALRPAVLLGIGASLDFLAGVRKRAPKFISSVGLEWLFRLVQEPKRLAYRYLVRDPRFVGILVRQMLAKRRIDRAQDAAE